MTQDFSTAFTLLAIGMITVFLVLFLVVLTGNLLIRFVNRLAPKAVEGIPAKTVAAITAAVDAFTEVKGRITKIEKE